jgi:hypothetical protein
VLIMTPQNTFAKTSDASTQDAQMSWRNLLTETNPLES